MKGVPEFEHQVRNNAPNSDKGVKVGIKALTIWISFMNVPLNVLQRHHVMCTSDIHRSLP